MKIAILDYDNTLSEGYTRYELGFLMEEKGMVQKGLREEIEELQGNYEQGHIDYNTKFRDDKEIFGRYYEGLKRTDIVRFIREEFDLRTMVFPWTAQFIEILKKNDFLTVVVSGCWDFILEEAQEIVQFDTFFGTEFHFEKNVATGDFTTIMDENKKRSVTKSLLQTAEFTLGMGDSVADFEILDQTNISFLYEPKYDAQELAKQRSYTVVDRQNVLEKLQLSLKDIA